MFRTLYAWTIFFLSTPALGLLAIALSLFDSSGNLPHRVARLWAKVQLRSSGTKVTVRGLENADPGGNYILVSNHQSSFDIFVLLGCLPLQFRWLAKAELFRIPFLGWSMSRIGYIPIERDSPKKAYRSLLKAAERLRGGTSVMIFPEGTRSPDGRLQPFKKGVFLLALKSQASILPIAVRGTGRVMAKGAWRICPAQVEIIIELPIPTAGLPPLGEEDLSARIRQVLSRHLPGD